MDECWSVNPSRRIVTGLEKIEYLGRGIEIERLLECGRRLFSGKLQRLEVALAHYSRINRIGSEGL
jgi:hypothetical protein